MKPWLAVALTLGAMPIAIAQKSGQAEVSLQGYYLGIAPQPVAATSGVAIKFQEFLPGFGLLNGSLEGYRNQGDLQAGDNFLEVRGLRWRGLHVSITGGDFRTSASPLVSPFLNIYVPELTGRGVKVEAGNSTRRYTFFLGEDTVQAGPRIPFRVAVPQTSMGMSVRQKFGRLDTGVRLLHLQSSAAGIQSHPNYFSAGRDYTSADNLTGYASLRFSEHLRWYSEATVARSRTLSGRDGGGPLSYFFGPVWESTRLTFRLNYASLSNTYLPIVGQLAGDRRGPFGEVRIRPVKRLELFGSASTYESVPWKARPGAAIESSSKSAGVSLQLPLGFSATGQLSAIRLRSFRSDNDETVSANNRQWTGSISKHIYHQNLRFTLRDLKLNYNGSPSLQKSREVEDIVQIKRVSFGAAVRSQQLLTTVRRDSLFVRGVVSAQLGRLTAFANFETGKDLVNETLFATNVASTTVIGANVRLAHRWTASVEAFRSRSLSELNPTSEFFLASQGLGVDPVLSRFQQWSVLIRVSRTFAWGAAMPSSNFDVIAAKEMPLTGSITGFVHVAAVGGLRPVPGIAVTLESGRSVTTDMQGRYLLEEVSEGRHVISLDLEHLPAEYNPGSNAKKNITVSPRKTVRVDLDLVELSGLRGQVTVKEGSKFESLENIVIRLAPGGRYTTTLPDGSFAFYNLPVGEYEAEIAVDTLPDEATLLDQPKRPVSLGRGPAGAPLRFEIERTTTPVKPTRKVLDIQIGPLAPAR